MLIDSDEEVEVIFSFVDCRYIGKVGSGLSSEQAVNENTVTAAIKARSEN